jgi:hypothetical protein
MCFNVKHAVSILPTFLYEIAKILSIETYLACVVVSIDFWMPCSDSRKLLNGLFSDGVITQHTPPVGIPGRE